MAVSFVSRAAEVRQVASDLPLQHIGRGFILSNFDICNPEGPRRVLISPALSRPLCPVCKHHHAAPQYVATGQLRTFRRMALGCWGAGPPMSTGATRHNTIRPSVAPLSPSPAAW